MALGAAAGAAACGLASCAHTAALIVATASTSPTANFKFLITCITVTPFKLCPILPFINCMPPAPDSNSLLIGSEPFRKPLGQPVRHGFWPQAGLRFARVRAGRRNVVLPDLIEQSAIGNAQHFRRPPPVPAHKF